MRRRISTEQIGRAFDTMVGSSETRLKDLMEKTGLSADKLIKTLSVYRARHWARQEFPNFMGGSEGRKPPKDKETVLNALNKAGSIVQAAKLLKTTPITLNKWIGYYKFKQIIEYGGDKKISWK
jgi:hypothetical protein